MTRSINKARIVHSEMFYLETIPAAPVDPDGQELKRYRILSKGTTDTQCVQASAPTDIIIGVSPDVTHDQVNEPVSVIMQADSYPIRVGAAVLYGQFVTTDAEGRAIPATAGQRIVGMALGDEPAVDELVNVRVFPGVMA